ncbi:uncharacterized protein LOC129619281 [Condylostylus longicornis]|uniref:uncharacterized protein LOC129619281 n=1 Tax=Condylostylus longicornis TaxID=2530218 RepID=UPI00244E5200|nr:uncharacterized protein LOC129619281 [Condylostylus longicornis]
MDNLTIYTESPGGCRKRKREYYETELQTQKEEAKTVLSSSSNGIVNPAFRSSTPNKEFTRPIRKFSKRFKSVNLNKENVRNISAQTESAPELQSQKNKVCELENPFEVVRKLPAKKKKPDIEECCFENAALNLNAPEKVFNPFEIRRITSPSKETTLVKDSCFVNNGLDIRVRDTNVNPYEVARSKSPVQNPVNGILNPALDICSPNKISDLKNFAIALPFQPTTTCRIDFGNIPLESLLREETSNTLKKTLEVIAEDDEIDIGKELDCYQLELENSINEAKLKKSSAEIINSNLMQGDSENVVLENTPITDKISPSNILEMSFIANENKGSDTKNEQNISESEPEINLSHPNNIVTGDPEKTVKNDQDSNSSMSGNPDLEEPTPFVRYYRKPLVLSKPQEMGNLEDIADEPIKEVKLKIGTAIRKSIRKFITHSNKKVENENNIELRENNEATDLNQNHNIFRSIRQSLRRKPSKTNQLDQEPKINQNEISIVDCTERTKVFRSPKFKNQTKDNLKTERLKNIFTKNKYNF